MQTAQVRINNNDCVSNVNRWHTLRSELGRCELRLRRLVFGFDIVLASIRQFVLAGWQGCENHVLICFDYAHFAFETFLIESFAE